MRKVTILASAALVSLSLAACGTTATQRAATGALGGAAVGGVVSGDVTGVAQFPVLLAGRIAGNDPAQEDTA